MRYGRRIGKVEGDLSPKQAVLAWMQQAHEFATPFEYRLWLSGTSKGSRPLIRIPQQIAAAERKRLSGRGIPRTFVEQRVRTAVKDAAFLFHLHRETNDYVKQDLEKIELRLILLEVSYQGLLAHEWLHSCLIRESLRLLVELDDCPPGAQEDVKDHSEILCEKVADWPEVEADLREHIDALIEACALISRQYLDDNQVLYPGLEKALAEDKEKLAELRGAYRWLVGRELPRSEREAIARAGRETQTVEKPEAPPREKEHDQEVHAEAVELARDLVLAARLAVLENLEEHDKQYRLIDSRWARARKERAQTGASQGPDTDRLRAHRSLG